MPLLILAQCMLPLYLLKIASSGETGFVAGEPWIRFQEGLTVLVEWEGNVERRGFNSLT